MTLKMKWLTLKGYLRDYRRIEKMNLLLIFDRDFDINKEVLSNFLKKQNFQSIITTIYQKNIEIKERFITKPSSFNQIKNNIDNIDNYNKIIVFTNKQYEDNYFFHTEDNIVICSFYGWKYFTNLSKSNGIIYFIIDILALDFDSSFQHQEATGCIYDFLWDKTGIDKGMRHASFCKNCESHLENSINEKSLLVELQTLMEKLSIASKNNQDILSINDKNNTSNKKNIFSASDINITNETILISKLINKLKENTIKLDNNHEFWDEKQMSRFIESILLKLPLPALYFDVSNPKKWQIVDGLNRLNTIKKFIIEKEFKLNNLEFLKKLNDKSYENLDGSLKRVLDETAMITYQVGVRTPKVVRDSIFKRINNKRGKR